MTSLFNGSNRKLFQIVIAGKKKKLLPVFLHISEEDREWADSADYGEVMIDVTTLILDNIEDIEETARADAACRNFTRLPPTGKHIYMSYMPTKEFNTLNSNIISLSGNEPQLQTMSSFALLAWIFPMRNNTSSLTTKSTTADGGEIGAVAPTSRTSLSSMDKLLLEQRTMY